jgi:hypothetical protein
VVRATAGVELGGGRLHAKAEHLQRTGSYKVRGATFRIARLTAAEHAAGVIAISAGNHGAAVAVAAGLLGVHAVVVMPETAVRTKVEACRGYGAEVILEGVDTTEAWAAMERIRDARGVLSWIEVVGPGEVDKNTVTVKRADWEDAISLLVSAKSLWGFMRNDMSLPAGERDAAGLKYAEAVACLHVFSHNYSDEALYY